MNTNHFLDDVIHREKRGEGGPKTWAGGHAIDDSIPK